MIKDINKSIIEINSLHNHSRQIKLFVHCLNKVRLQKAEKSESSLAFVSILKDHIVFYYKPILNNSNPVTIYYTTYFNTANTDLVLGISSRYNIYNYYKKNKSGIFFSKRFKIEGFEYKIELVMLPEDQEPIKILELSRMYTKGLFTGNSKCD